MKISELIKTVEVKIPKTDLVIKIKTELSWCEQLEYFEKWKDKSVTERGKWLICKLVVDWNLEGEDKKSLPVTEEIIGRLPATVAIPLSAKVEEIAKEKILKKND